MRHARFVRYDFQSAEIFELEVETISASNHAWDGRAAPVPVHLLVIHDLHPARVSWVIPESVRRNYNEHHGVGSSPNEASEKTGADGVNLDGFLKHDLLYEQAGDNEYVTEEALASARQ